MSHRNSSTRLTSIARAIRHQTVSSERSINPVLIVVAIAFSLILLVGIAVTVSGATYTFNRYTEIAKGVIPPEELIANLPQGGARIYDRNGSLMYEFVDEFTGLRRPVQLENISHWLIEATLAVEDPTIYENNGLNKNQVHSLIKILAQDFGVLASSNIKKPEVSDIKLHKPKLIPPDSLLKFCTNEPYERVLHSFGQSQPDSIRIFDGDFKHAPDVIAYPERSDQINAIYDWASGVGAAIVPYGGGSSVVGGVTPDIEGLSLIHI